MQEGQELTWKGLIEEIVARFSPEASDNPIGELKKLQQIGLVDEYRRRFEELRGLTLARNPILNEEFFMKCFMGGLKLEIQLGIQEFRPKTLKDMIRLSRVEEAKLEAWLKRSRVMNKPTGSTTYSKPVLMPQHKPATMVNGETVRSLPIRGLTREQINEKKRKGLCFLCDA